MMLSKRLKYLLPLILFVGCAKGYHDYPCGRVSCGYCPPNPLPYSLSESCNCSGSKGQEYLANMHSEKVIMEPLRISQNAENRSD